MEKTKACTRCKKVRKLERFHKDSERRDGKRSVCKRCRSKEAKANKVQNRKYMRLWRKKHPNYYIQYRKKQKAKITAAT